MVGEAQEEVSKGAEQKVEEKDVRRESFMSNIPTSIIILVSLAFIFLFIKAQQSGADGWKTVGPWIVGLILIIMFYGMRQKKYGILLEPEIKYLLSKRIEEKRRTGEIPRNVYTKMQLESGLKWIDGKPRYYIGGVTFIHPDLLVEYKKVTIDAFDGNITWQNAEGKVSGNETVEVKNIMKQIMRDAEKIGVFRQMLRGGGR